MKTMKLTPFAKILIFVLLAAVILVPTYLLGGFNSLLGGSDKPTDVVSNGTNAPAQTTAADSQGTTAAPVVSSDALSVSLDEWIGWKPIIDANGGLDTKPGSIYDKLGLKVKINIINDATQSSNALINGSLNAAGYTVNRYAFLYPKFKENNVPVKMVYATNYSNGGDGIISSSDINGIEGLAGKKIGIPRFSEAQTLVEWLLAKSSMTDAQKGKVNKVMFDTPDDAAKAFFAGQVDAAATWQPYLSQAQSGGNKILFSTRSASNIIIDGIVFREDYMNANKDKVMNFIRGALKAADLYTKEFAPIKDSMPLFATETDESIKGMTGDAALTDCNGNVKVFDGIIQTLYTDMANIWKNLGEKSDASAVNAAFDGSLVKELVSEFPAATVATTPKFTEQQRQTVKAQDNKTALLKQTFSIQFKVNSDEFTDKEAAYTDLGKFIETAKILDNTLIQIEGNTSSDGNATANLALSEKRAKAIATYLKFQGVDPTRFIILGNGSSKPIGDDKTEAGRNANRRTDIFFKVINN